MPGWALPGSRKPAKRSLMSSEIAIRVDHLGKCYQIYDKPHHRLLQMLVRNRRKYYRDFWALKDVSFEVKRGETVGIVGRNGSGKSTLLQLICSTLHPTCGNLVTDGRIAALLELGSGFNPEFTGRENAYMNAAILGLSKAETDSRYDAIAAFADIGDFIDQPVKTYSSGMVVRLAFAVAINVDPQILVVDEALSVGDERFQRKCFSRIEEIKNSGATVLFVSHSGTTVVELCDRAILLDRGELLTSGVPKIIIAKYQRLLYAPDDKREEIREEIKLGHRMAQRGSSIIKGSDNLKDAAVRPNVQDPEEYFDINLKPQSTTRYESRGAIVGTPQILNLAGEPVNCLKRGHVYRYTYDVRFTEAAQGVRFGLMIKTLTGIELGGGATAAGMQEAIPYIPVGATAKAEFRFQCNLNPGTYFLNAGLVGAINGEETYLHRVIDACMFRVIPEQGNTATGIVDFKCVPDITFMTDDKISLSA